MKPKSSQLPMSVKQPTRKRLDVLHAFAPCFQSSPAPSQLTETRQKETAAAVTPGSSPDK